METPPQKKRGRPRNFDPDQAIIDATATFIRFGYSGASLESLTDAMKLNKPSLYAAFGDKRGLFVRTLEVRAKALGKRYRTAWERGDDLESSLRAIFHEAIAINLDDQDNPGCLFGSAAITEAVVDQELAKFTRDFFVYCDRGIAKWLEERKPGAGSLTKLVNGIVHDIALRARIGDTKAELRAYAKEAARALTAAAG
ncbi:MAG: TetR/AcrR family transcriptional regulator [Polyangiaceae bacterium]